MSDNISLNELSKMEMAFRSRILDADQEASYNNLVGLIASVMRAPIALITLTDDGETYRSKINSTLTETPRKDSFCARTIFEIKGPMIVNDAHLDERFAQNPFVLGDPKIRFYCGFPLIDSKDKPIGSICALDVVPRSGATPEQMEAMGYLSKIVMEQLNLFSFIFDTHQKLEEWKNIKIDTANRNDIMALYKNLNSQCDEALARMRTRKR